MCYLDYIKHNKGQRTSPRLNEKWEPLYVAPIQLTTWEQRKNFAYINWSQISELGNGDDWDTVDWDYVGLCNRIIAGDLELTSESTRRSPNNSFKNVEIC